MSESKQQHNQSTLKKILIIHPEGNINNNPGLTGIVEILCEHGYKVEILSPRRPGYIEQDDPCEGAVLKLIDPSIFHHAFDYIFAVPQHLQLASKRDMIHSYISENFGTVDLVIGVDRGIMHASFIAQALHIPYGLISYEIFFNDETGTLFKQPEIDACRNVAFVICQDRIRSSLLSKENHIPLERFIDIPVAGRHSFPPSDRKYTMHQKIGLNNNTKIALYIGTITESWGMIGELLESTFDWPSDWVLCLHHRYGTEMLYKLYKQFPFLNNSDKVFPSPLSVLKFHDLYTLLHEVDLGIAFYVPTKLHITTGNNIRYIGMASGKVSTYLQHGLPVMVNETGLLSDTVIEHNIGYVIKNKADIGNILKNLTREELSRCSKNVIQFSHTYLDLTTHCKSFLDLLEKLLT